MMKELIPNSWGGQGKLHTEHINATKTQREVAKIELLLDWCDAQQEVQEERVIQLTIIKFLWGKQ